MEQSDWLQDQRRQTALYRPEALMGATTCE
jgi:hypothetical protein